MGLESNNSSQQPSASSDQPPAAGQEAYPQPDLLSNDAPLATSLSSTMKSLTPNAPETSGDSAPQYPSLEAAVGVEQQVAPTLTNLLAAQTQPGADLGLGTPGIAVSAATAVSMGIPAPRQSANEPQQSSQVNPAASMMVESEADELAPSTTSAAALKEEQAPLAGQDIAVQLPEPDELASAASDHPSAASDLEQDASWEALSQEEAPEISTTETASTATATGAEPAASLEAQIPAAPTASSEADAVAQETEAETSPTPAEATEGDRQENVDSNSSEEGDPTENDDFDQVREGAAEGDRAQQVLIKREDNHVAIMFPKEETNVNPDVAVDFIDSQLWQDLQQRLSGGTAFADNTPVHLYSQNCLLDTRQLQELDEALGRFNLKLARIVTGRRQTAVAAAMSGYSADQTNDLPELLSKEVFSPQRIGLAEPLYLQKNIRSGTEIRHPGSVVVMGDLNPGSSVIADGDILVWGRLRGIAHAGAAGNKASTIMALKLEATQLRIAGAVARVAAQGKGNPSPEIAYINDKAIRITSAYGFNRSELGQ